MNNGFAFYQNYWEAIQSLPIDQQKEVCYAIVYYGITGEMVNPASFPIGYAMTQGFKPAIDNSVDRWNSNVVKAEIKHDSYAERDDAIIELIKEGLNSAEIADKLGMSSSAVRKTRAWRSRFLIGSESSEENVKNGKIVNNVQNGKNVKIVPESVKNVTDENGVKNVKNVRESVKNVKEDFPNFHTTLESF